MDKKDYELTAKITRLANRGVRKSINKAKRAGVANPFVLDGKLMYKLPDGMIAETFLDVNSDGARGRRKNGSKQQAGI